LSGTLPKEYSTMKFISSWDSRDTDIDPIIPDEWTEEFGLFSFILV